MLRTIAKAITVGMLLAALVYFLGGCAGGQFRKQIKDDLRRFGIWSDKFEHSWHYEHYPYGDSSYIAPNPHYNRTHYPYLRQHYRNDLRRFRSWLGGESNSKSYSQTN